jgi:oxalate decarboxylase/phosphoglucose isomerase-like protein (cupin superfamily)
MNPERFVVNQNDVETIMTSEFTAKVMCDQHIAPLQGMSAVALFLDPGKGHSRHNHADSEQIIYVISGQGTHVTELADGISVTENIGPGSLISIPKGVQHSTFNTGWEPMRIFTVFTPSGPEASLRRFGDSAGTEAAPFRVFPPGETPIRD